MALTEKTTIVFEDGGRKKKVLISWLLSQSAQWAYDANKFIIIDPELLSKVEGESFAGQPVKPQLIMKYPYLKTVFDEAAEDLHADYTEKEQAEEEHQEMNPADKLVSDLIDIEEIQRMGLDDIKAYLTEKDVKFDGRKKDIEYFRKLAYTTID